MSGTSWVDHPMDRYAARRGWDYDTSASHFGLPARRYRQVVTGWSGLAFRLAEQVAARSQGEFSVVDVLAWQDIHRRHVRDGRPRKPRASFPRPQQSKG